MHKTNLHFPLLNWKYFLHFIPVALSIVIALLWIYWPGLTDAYDFHDSFYTYAYTNKEVCNAHPQTGYYLYIGRPLLNLINCFMIAGQIDTLQDTVFVRAIAFLLLTASMIMVATLIRAMGYNRLTATVIAIGLGSLPGMQLFIFMTLASTILWTLPPILAASAVFFYARHSLFSLFNNFSSALIKALLLLLVSAFLLFIASLIYQQTSSLFFLFTGLMCLSPKIIVSPHKALTLMGAALLVYALHGLVYLAVFHQFILPEALSLLKMTLEEAQGERYDVVVSSDLFGKLQFLMTNLFVKGLRLWTIGEGHPFTQLVAISFFLSIIFWVLYAFNQAKTVNKAQPQPWYKSPQIVIITTLSLIIATLVLVNAPNLIAQTSSATSRHTLIFQATIIALIVAGAQQFWSLKKYAVTKQALVSSVVAMAVTGAVSARHNFDFNMSGIAKKEIAYIQKALTPHMANLPERIIVIQPNVFTLTLAGDAKDTFDENGALTTRFWQDVRWITLAAYLDLGGDRRLFPKIEAIHPGEMKQNPGKEKALVIDMRKLVYDILDKRFDITGPFAQ